VRYACGLTTVAATALLLAAGPLHGQYDNGSLGIQLDNETRGEALFQQPPFHSERHYILIRLDENRLYFMDRNRVVWSAPVGTGNGFQLEASGGEWDFSTPHGVFRVQRKEKDPVWIRPNWAYIKEGKPVPPLNSPERRDEEMLGTTAIYLQYDIAVHGTNAPELDRLLEGRRGLHRLEDRRDCR
jgi:hypothetical protein